MWVKGQVRTRRPIVCFGTSQCGHVVFWLTVRQLRFHQPVTTLVLKAWSDRLFFTWLRKTNNHPRRNYKRCRVVNCYAVWNIAVVLVWGKTAKHTFWKETRLGRKHEKLLLDLKTNFEGSNQTIWDCPCVQGKPLAVDKAIKSVVECPLPNWKVGCSIHGHWVIRRTWARAFTSTASAKSIIKHYSGFGLPPIVVK